MSSNTKIYTLGYAKLYSKLGVPWDKDNPVVLDKIKELVEEKNAELVDIRKKPYGLLSKPALKEKIGDKYNWVRKWGHPLWKQDRNFKTGFNEVPSENIILMCCEKDVNDCHRKQLSYKIKKEREGSEVVHIYQEKPIQRSLAMCI